MRPAISLAVLTLAVLGSVTTASAADEAKRLFNDRDLTGWTPYLWDRGQNREDTTTPASDVWSVRDGMLICQGRPTGYLRTNEQYHDYRLTLEWRWPEGSTGGNNGVLVHTTTPNALGQWPKSIEVQLAHGNAGDFWVIGSELDVENEAERKLGRRHLNLTDDSEKPIGQWNQMEITCRGTEILVKVNGVEVNHATNCSETKGFISLQSEGAEVHFRNMVLTPLR